MGIFRHGILAIMFVAACAGAAAPGAPPVVVVEEHHQAWPVWERARAEGRIGPGAVLVHLDAHEDLGVPEVTTRVAPDSAQELADTELTVDEAVVPALFTGTVAELVWVTPSWLDEPPRETIRQVGSVGGEGLSLRVGERLPDCPDRREFRTRVLPLEKLAEVAGISGPVILDIDLDFFACENPHAGHRDVAIDREEYQRRLDQGEVRLSGRSDDADGFTESVILRRPPGPFTWPVRLDRVVQHGGETSYLRGWMCMGEYGDTFPVHRPSDRELREQVEAVRAKLDAAKLSPALITISRSAHSGFVPAERVDSIERLIITAIP